MMEMEMEMEMLIAGGRRGIARISGSRFAFPPFTLNFFRGTAVLLQ